MNRILSLLLLLAAMPLLVNAQTNWKIKRIGAAFGKDQDMLHAMSYRYFLKTTADETQYDYSGMQLTEDYVYSMLCENPHLRAGITLQNAALPRVEWSFNGVYMENRVDEVAYSTPGGDWGHSGFQHLSFQQITNELALESVLSYRLQSGGWFLTGSLGGNMGYIFGGNMSINGSNINVNNNQIGFRDPSDSSPSSGQYIYEDVAIRDGASVRAFAQLSGGFMLFKRIELGLDIRYGTGLRMIISAPTIGTELHSFGFRAGWVLR